MDGFFSVYLSGVLNVARDYYHTLDSISIYGVSVLDFCITLTILSIVLPLLITLVRSNLRSSSRVFKERIRRNYNNR